MNNTPKGIVPISKQQQTALQLNPNKTPVLYPEDINSKALMFVGKVIGVNATIFAIIGVIYQIFSFPLNIIILISFSSLVYILFTEYRIRALIAKTEYLDKENEDTKAEIERLNKENEDIKAEIERLNKENEDIRQKLMNKEIVEALNRLKLTEDA